MSTEPSVTPEELTKKRVARYDYYYDVRTFSYALRKTSKPKKPKKVRQRRYAITVRRLIDERGRHVQDIIDISSPRLCEVLIEINEGVEGTDLSRSEPEVNTELMFRSYPGLVQRLQLEEKKDPKDEDLILDIKAAILVVEEDQGKTMRDLEKLTSQNQITFDLLWAMFIPNTLVFNHHTLIQQDRLLFVRRVGYGERMSDRKRYLKVVCEMVHNDGHYFGFAREHLEIEEFRGAVSITDLNVYPLEYRADKATIYEVAVHFGKIFAQMKPHSYHEIRGQAMREGEQRIEKFFTTGRVMISPSAFRHFGPDVSYNPEVRKPMGRENLKDDLYAICNPMLLGFSFERKSWGAFAMSRLRDVVWNDDAFQALVLGDKQKKLIHALVREHASESNEFDDVIVGKGRGLIGLLAGTPGCGKTLTAEAVAEITRKPLYAVSAGELGTTPESVEHRLKRVLELAQMWDAVLLLDEAEVFLQQRDVMNVKRNALVSIFLRELEYYQGILILTTNMPEQCDAAFESRIHFSVHYPKLDLAARRTIWAMFFQRASIEIDDTELDRLASREINGRQIKNVFSSAMTISRAEGTPKLDLTSVDVVLEVLNDWQSAARNTKAER
ncbi:P-loop containing nucleoside triphosphate hydrolase protein [Schizopora paradoxa]|uniref:p-loop containing nucleoside triphosphate hydrolase protein n=1 Tax=Schizopora paradoxa TaxID=27342 RepID=A0A0H2REE5_9AGAM|nr:P-loop containing nucleoside triphosphate hydrolase protein [Schizopora paradoxa]